MILKKMKRTMFVKSRAAMIRDLVNYILAPKDGNEVEKLAYAGAKNFFAETPAGQRAEMIALASESVHSKMPVTHWIMSWQENEQPSNEQIDEAVDVFLKRMELEGHQVIYALHKNSAHSHVHIVVNRTNPETEKVIQPHRGFDIEEAHRIVALLVHTQGWAAENHARYRVNEAGEIVRNAESKSIVKLTDRAANFESGSGEKSAMRIAQERGHSVIKNAKTWKELHEGLSRVGLRMERKGSGAIVFVGETAVKASSVHRDFGLSKLCKRLGEYEAGDYAPEIKAPEPEPVSFVAQDEWREYQKLRDERKEERRVSRQQQDSVVMRVKNEQRRHRTTALSALARHGLSILNIARHCLKIQQREALKRLREEQLKPCKPLPRFVLWLAQKNMWMAKCWKYRRRIAIGMKVKEFTFPKIGNLASPYQAYSEMIRKKHPEKMDPSRRDSLVALWMRATGYTLTDTANELYQKARPLREKDESRDWRQYVRNTAWYAFGASGDIDIAAASLKPEAIQNFQQAAARLEEQREEARETPRMR